MEKFKDMEMPEVKLSYKQKLILNILQDEFHGAAFGPQLLDESDNEDLHKLSINEITWAFKVLVEAALIDKCKKVYNGRLLNFYSLSNFMRSGVIKIK